MVLYLLIKIFSIRLLTLAHMENNYLSIEKRGEIFLLNLSNFNKKFFQEIIIKKRILYLRRKNILLSIGLNGDRLEAEGFKRDHTKYGFLEDKKVKKQYYGIKTASKKRLDRKKENIFRTQKIKLPEKKTLNFESEMQSEVQKMDMKPEIKKIQPPVNPVKPIIKKSPYHIESDSSNETNDLNITIENVKILEIGANRFLLKGVKTGNIVTDDCLTFFQNKFTFLPCINSQNQIFKLVNHTEMKESVNYTKKKFHPHLRKKRKRFNLHNEKINVKNFTNMGEREGNIFKEIYSTLNDG